MALPPTLFTWEISLADADREVYETLSLRFARHPSESEDFLLTRVLAYCLEWREGIAFSSGLSTPDLPAILHKDLDGTIRTWIDIGLPDSARLHKAGKLASEVIVYPHRQTDVWLRSLQGATIYGAERLRIVCLDRELVASAARHVERRQKVSVARSGGQLYLDLGTHHAEGAIEERQLF